LVAGEALAEEATDTAVGAVGAEAGRVCAGDSALDLVVVDVEEVLATRARSAGVPPSLVGAGEVPWDFGASKASKGETKSKIDFFGAAGAGEGTVG
jgi:hypothetical protein